MATQENGAELTSAAEDYLKAIYGLDVEGKRATTSALAERMGVSAPSATAMMKRLAELGGSPAPAQAP